MSSAAVMIGTLRVNGCFMRKAHEGNKKDPTVCKQNLALSQVSAIAVNPYVQELVLLSIRLQRSVWLKFPEGEFNIDD